MSLHYTLQNINQENKRDVYAGHTLAERWILRSAGSNFRDRSTSL